MMFKNNLLVTTYSVIIQVYKTKLFCMYLQQKKLRNFKYFCLQKILQNSCLSEEKSYTLADNVRPPLPFVDTSVIFPFITCLQMLIAFMTS